MRVHHIALRCRDLPAVSGFYRDLLGLRTVREQPGYSVWLALEDAVLMLEQAAPDEPYPDGRSQQALIFDAADAPLDLRDRLAASRVAIESETQFTYYFRDPEGRKLGVSAYGLPELGSGSIAV